MIDYTRWKKILKQERLPAVVVDLDAFDRNLAKAVKMAKDKGKTIRLATKSVRVPELIIHAIKSGKDVFEGLMCFSAEEAELLRSHGLDDILIAYPTLQPSDLQILRKLHEDGAKIRLVVDSASGVQALAVAMASVSKPFQVLIDVDASLRFWNGKVHLGVRRSPIRTPQDALKLADTIAQQPHLELRGIMAYEAQVAGLGDRNPFKPLINPIAKIIRDLSIKRVAKLRAEIVAALKAKGYRMEVVNGAGTGSLNYALAEEALTEVTIGSGLLCSHLFDYYSNIQFEPACFFALQAIRSSDPGYITCQGGGYIASGEPGWDKTPVPYLPAGLKLLPNEGCGEVQTPFQLPELTQVALGEPVLFRHAKAGELAERFSDYLLVSNDAIVTRAKTYRGLGRSFF